LLGTRPDIGTRIPGNLVNDTPNSCYGFSIRSEIALRFTRPGTSADQLSIVEMRGDAPQHDEPHILDWLTPNGVVGRLYGGGHIFDFWAEGVGWYRIAPLERTVEVPPSVQAVRREVHLWGVPMMVTFTRLGDLSMHCAAIERNGRGVIVAAPGRHGKTTLALALHAAGCRLLTEDIARVRLEPEAVVLPGPAVVRMRSDALRSVPDGMTKVASTSTRINLEIDQYRRGDSEPVPLAAIVLLRIGESDQLRLERAASAPALRDLWALAFRIPQTDDRARVFQQLADLVAAVPVYDFERPLTFESLPDVVAQVMALCDS
jgi:hypothetical protein